MKQVLTVCSTTASGVSPSASPAVPTPRTRFDTATSIKLAILAEKYCIAELADIAMNVLQCASGPNFVKYSAILAADKMISHSDSKLRLYLSRALACKLSRGTDHLAMPHLFSLANSHPQLGLETFRILAGGGKTRHPACFPPCDYHQHAKNEPCPTASKKRKREEDEDEETDEVEKIYQAVRRRERMILKAEFDEGSVARSHCRSTPK